MLHSKATWIAITLVFGVVDVISGMFVRVDLLHVIPTAGATWFVGRRFGIGTALALTLVRPVVVFLHVWMAPWSRFDVVINALLGAATLALAVIAVQQTRARMIARAEVHALRGLLPICSYCKKIRSDTNVWDRIEKYISEHSDATFTHGICPECAKEHFGFDDSTR
jgi:hypothetical protein